MNRRRKPTMVENVEKILKDTPQTRNSDLKLFFEYIERFDGVPIPNDIQQRITMATSVFSLERVRRKLQEQRPDLR